MANQEYSLNALLSGVGESVERIEADPETALVRIIERIFPDYHEWDRLPLEQIERRIGITQ